MAIYHLHMRYDSRGKGKSSVASCAYILGTRMRDERTGETYAAHKDPTRVKASGVELAPTMPPEWLDPQAMVNAGEAAVRQDNAIVARKMTLALPCELSDEEQEQLVKDYIHAELNDRGYGCVWAIHRDTNNENPHAHLLIPDQPYADGKWQPKTKTQYVLDKNGEKIPKLDKNGKQKLGKRNRKLWEREQRNHFLGTRDGLKTLRAAWSTHANNALEKAGSEERVDHRSYKDQGSPLIPTKHEGFVERARASTNPNYFSPVIYNNALVQIRNARTLERLNQEQQTLLTPTIILASDLPVAYKQLIDEAERVLLGGDGWDVAIRTIQEYYSHSTSNVLAITGARITHNDPIWHSRVTGYHRGHPSPSPLLHYEADWPSEVDRFVTDPDRDLPNDHEQRAFYRSIANRIIDLSPKPHKKKLLVPIGLAIREVIRVAGSLLRWITNPRRHMLEHDPSETRTAERKSLASLIRDVTNIRSTKKRPSRGRDMER